MIDTLRAALMAANAHRIATGEALRLAEEADIDANTAVVQATNALFEAEFPGASTRTWRSTLVEAEFPSAPNRTWRSAEGKVHVDFAWIAGEFRVLWAVWEKGKLTFHKSFGGESWTAILQAHPELFAQCLQDLTGGAP
jgi:hypothetical protein